ncbi:14170_t:CDS:2, partial [Racocetra persica]
LIENGNTWLKDNFVMVMSTVFKIQSFKRIQSYVTTALAPPVNSYSNILAVLSIADELALDKLIERIKESTVCIDPEPLLFELEKFPTLEKEIFMEFIKRDDLGTAQLTSLSDEKPVNTDVASWGDNEFSRFKKKIEPFITYVRFCGMSRAEFYHQVMPFERALPEDLYKKLVAYFMADIKPKRIRVQQRVEMANLDSAIINRKNSRAIVRWIKGIAVFTKQPSYEFILSYRATRCEFDHIELICKLKGYARVALIKVKDSDRIIGGYIGNKPNVDGLVFGFGSVIDSNFNTSCRVKFCSSLGSSSIDFGNGYLKFLKESRPENISIFFNGTNITAEEIEIFEIRIMQY